MPGSYHDLGVDVTLFLLEPLSPDAPAAIDTARSAFEIQQGVVHQGHVVSGVVAPCDCPVWRLTQDASLVPGGVRLYFDLASPAPSYFATYLILTDPQLQLIMRLLELDILLGELSLQIDELVVEANRSS